MNAASISYEEWLNGQGLRSNTVRQRVNFLRSREREWRSLHEVTSAEIGLWLATYSGWSAITYYNHLTSVFEWLVDTRQIGASPMTTVRRPATPRVSPRPLNAAQVTQLLDDAQGDVRAYMLLALLAGLRAHEVAKFRGEDVDEQMIRVVGKGGVDATIPTHPVLWELALSYPREGYWFQPPKRPGEPIRPALVTEHVARRFRALGIPTGSIHRLRATYATTLLQHGVNLRVIQTLMRHTSLATTERYLGVDEDERAAAIRLLSSAGGSSNPDGLVRS